MMAAAIRFAGVEGSLPGFAPGGNHV